MDYNVLKDELDNDPLARGYAGFTDEQASADLNTEYRNVPRASMNGDEIFAATDNAEFTGLTDHKQQLWVSFTSKDIINAYEQTNIDFLDFIFGPASTTKTTLSALREETVSRAVELGLGLVKVGDVQFARSL